jgi:hypothetical protein
MSRVRRYSRSGPTAAPLRSSTGLSPSAVTRSSGLRLTGGRAARRLPPPPAHSSNPPQASPAGSAARGVWAPPRSLAATQGILSVPRGTEMFQFPRCPLRDRSQSARPCAGRVAPFGDPRIPGCQRLPGAFRRVAASFLGRQRQGIHHAPIMRIPDLVAHPADVVAATADRHAPAGHAAPDAAPGRCPARASCRTDRCHSMMCLCSARGRPNTSPAPAPITVRRGSRVTREPQRDARRFPRPQNPAGSAWRVVNVHGGRSPPVEGCSLLRSSNLVRSRTPTSDEVSHPRRPHGPRVLLTGAGPARPNRGVAPPHPGVEPRGFEPRTSAVQGRRSPG